MTKVSVAVNAPVRSQSMERIAVALTRYAPKSLCVVESEQDADVVLLHTIGFPETVEALDRLDAAGKRAIIAQYCLRTTQNPNTADWMPLWERAILVWTYYDLVTLALEDGINLCLPGKPSFSLGYSPLGVDPYVFKPPTQEQRIFTIGTSGYVAETEGVNECVDAVRRVSGRLFHLGPPGVAKGTHVTWGHRLTDEELCARYGQCKFVAGLRRGEGFEMPALEGLLCGARPIMFDRPHYRNWFEEYAEFVPEREAAYVERELIALFQEGPRPVTPQERVKVVKAFAWDRVAREFWKMVEHAL